VRAGPAQDTIAFLDVHQLGLAGRVEQHIGHGALSQLTDPGRTGWIPLAADVVFLDGLAELLGHEEAIAFFRASVARHFESPLLRSFVSGARRIFGLTPVGLVKLIPRIWPMVYKDLGTPQLDKREDDYTVVTLVEANSQLFDSQGYRCAWQGIFEGVIDAGGAAPDRLRVQIVTSKALGQFEIHLRW